MPTVLKRKKMRNRLTKKDTAFIAALVAITALLIFLMSGCTTAKKCAEKFPCVESVKVDTLLVENPNKQIVNNIIKEIEPCPEWERVEIPNNNENEPSNKVEVFNNKVKQVNSKNEAKKNKLKDICTDSIAYFNITKTVFDKSKQQQLNAYIENDKSALWHLKRLLIIKWQLFLLIAVLIFIYFKYVKK